MIYLFTIGMTRIQSSAAVLLLPLCALLGGRGAELLISVSALIMHEIAHTLMLKALGYGLDCIELQPFGFIARLAEPYENALDELTVAAIGPTASMVLGLLTLALTYSTENQLKHAELFGNISVTLGLMNLIPAYPLDGGKMLMGALSICLDSQKAKRVTIYVSMAIALLFSAVAVYLVMIDISGIPYAVMFVLLLVAALKERKGLEMANARRMILKQSRFRRLNTFDVRQIAINENSTILQAARFIVNGKYTMFTVLDNDMNIVKTISEGEIMRKLTDSKFRKLKE